MLGLVRLGKVKLVWTSPPFTTFQRFISPKHRLLNNPWCFDLLGPATTLGTLHAVQACLLCWIQYLLGKFFGHEHPEWGHMKEMPCWVRLSQQEHVFHVLLDWCRFGRDFSRTTRLTGNHPALKKLGLRCHHSYKHEKLTGRRANEAATYTTKFCNKLADLLKQDGLDPPETGVVIKDVGVSLGKRDAGFSDLGKFHITASQPLSTNTGPQDSSTNEVWDRHQQVCGDIQKGNRCKKGSPFCAVQLSESLTWRTWMQYQFKELQHINLQECKARKSLVKRLPRDKRVVICQDSRVNPGALAKGRSPSKMLNGLSKTEAPLILAKNLHISGVHFPTWSLRADAPVGPEKLNRLEAPFPSGF